MIGTSTFSLPEWINRDPRIRIQIDLDLSSAIRQSQGNFVGVIDAYSVLHPQILGIMARTAIECPTTNLLYCNEMAVNEENIVQTLRTKSWFDRATLLRTNFLGRLTIVKRELVEALSSDWANNEWQLFVLLSELGMLKPTHLPVFGCIQSQGLRDAPYNYVYDKDVYFTFLNSIFPVAQLSPANHEPKKGVEDSFCLNFHPKAARSLSVIVPYRDGFELTRRCLEALELQITTLKIQVLLVDNNSSSNTQSQVEAWLGSPRRHVYKQHSYQGAFNFAKINNQAVSQVISSSDFLLFLNNDVELISGNALDAMAGELDAHEEIAFVGIKLWYPERTAIQHGGIHITSTCEGLGFYRAEHIVADEEYVHRNHIVAAVTFASAMCRSEVWQKLGGLEELLFPNGYGDIDLCFRAFAAGYHNFYLGGVEGIHHESKTRKTNSEESEIALINERHAASFARWSTRTFCAKLAPREGVTFRARPLRYRIADLLNDALKSIGGHRHRKLKQFLSGKFYARKSD